MTGKVGGKGEIPFGTLPETKGKTTEAKGKTTEAKGKRKKGEEKVETAFQKTSQEETQPIQKKQKTSSSSTQNFLADKSVASKHMVSLSQAIKSEKNMDKRIEKLKELTAFETQVRQKFSKEEFEEIVEPLRKIFDSFQSVFETR